MAEKTGTSADGFIQSQEELDHLMYGVYPSSRNGCGWVAAYNVQHYLGNCDDPEMVFREMCDMLPFQGKRGTPFPVMAAYFRRRCIPVRRIYGTPELLDRLALKNQVSCGILRYAEERIPHYVTFFRVEGEGEARFRFLNVNEGKEDFVSDMQAFRRTHVTERLMIRVLLFERGAGQGKVQGKEQGKSRETAASGAPFVKAQ